MKAFSDNFRVISEDKRTVKIGQDSNISFKIYDPNQKEILHLMMPPTATVSDMMSTISRKIKNQKIPVDKIVCLQSLDNRQVIDYALLISDYQLKNFENHESFRIIISETVQSDKWASLNDFTFKKCLGRGASANVSLVRHRANGKLYALKQIEKGYFVEFKRMQQILRQKKIMTEIVNQFPFCARLLASFESQKHLNFLLQFYPGGQMFFHLQQRRLTEEEAKLYFAEMTLTFQYLHENKVVYRDLKPENIMIDFNGHAKLTDFGLCKINLNKQDLTTSYCGSIEYMAPQVKQNIGYNYSVDFYTLGAFLYEMVMGVPPYYNSQPLYFSQSSSSSYRNLVRGLIENSVQMRISSFKQIKLSKWLADINWKNILQGKSKMPFTVSPYQSYIHEQFKNISVAEYNTNHEQKYDRLFHFFTYFKNTKQNSELLHCYNIFNEETVKFAVTRSQKKNTLFNKSKLRKKSVRDRSLKKESVNRSKQSSAKKNHESLRSDKSKSKSKNPKSMQVNIYLKKIDSDDPTQKSSQHLKTNQKNPIKFNKPTITTTNLHHTRSNKQLLQNALYKL